MCWHAYSKWSNPICTMDKIRCGPFGERADQPFLKQIRTCAKCNKTESRTITEGKLTDLPETRRE